MFQLNVNQDVTILSNMNATGFGVITRDVDGEVIVTLCNSFNQAMKPEVAKAMALQKSIMFARDVDLSYVIFEGD